MQSNVVSSRTLQPGKTPPQAASEGTSPARVTANVTSEALAHAETEAVYLRVTRRPREHLERVADAALRWASARRRCDQIPAERELRAALESFHQK